LTLAELKAARPGSPDHQRLLTAVQTITAILEASRSDTQDPTPDLPPPSEGGSVEDLLARATHVAQRLRELQDDDDGETPAPAEPTIAADDVPALVKVDAHGGPAEPERCMFCRQTPDRCAQIRASAIDNWRTLHHNDPAEIQRRAEDDEDQLTAFLQGWPTERQIARAREGEAPETEEEKRQREERIRRGHEIRGSDAGIRRG
jgi:hypothetical protein